MPIGKILQRLKAMSRPNMTRAASEDSERLLTQIDWSPPADDTDAEDNKEDGPSTNDSGEPPWSLTIFSHHVAESSAPSSSKSRAKSSAPSSSKSRAKNESGSWHILLVKPGDGAHNFWELPCHHKSLATREGIDGHKKVLEHIETPDALDKHIREDIFCGWDPDKTEEICLGHVPCGPGFWEHICPGGERKRVPAESNHAFVTPSPGGVAISDDEVKSLVEYMCDVPKGEYVRWEWVREHQVQTLHATGAMKDVLKACFEFLRVNGGTPESLRKLGFESVREAFLSDWQEVHGLS